MRVKGRRKKSAKILTRPRPATMTVVTTDKDAEVKKCVSHWFFRASSDRQCTEIFVLYIFFSPLFFILFFFWNCKKSGGCYLRRQQISISIARIYSQSLSLSLILCSYIYRKTMMTAHFFFFFFLFTFPTCSFTLYFTYPNTNKTINAKLFSSAILGKV